MLGGSLTRYHTPTLQGKGLTRDMLKWATPAIMQSVGHGLESYARGATPMEAFEGSRDQLKRGLKRKLPSMVQGAVKRKLEESYKNKRKRVRDIIGIAAVTKSIGETY